jgi:hypothetical protein
MIVRPRRAKRVIWVKGKGKEKKLWIISSEKNELR